MLGKTGIYNYRSRVISWYDFSLAIRDLAGADCEITPCLSSEYPGRRAVRCGIGQVLGTKDFRYKNSILFDSLKKCIEQLSHEN